MKIVMIGNGLSSQIFMKCMKAKCKKEIEFIVIEKNSLKPNEYIDDVPFYFNHVLDCYKDKFSGITVKMGIYENGRMYIKGNKEIAEKYSLKVIGEVTDNTIMFIEPEKTAYIFMDLQGYKGRKMSLFHTIMEENQDCKYIYNSEVFKIDINHNILYYRTNGENNSIEYDFIISTIPLVQLNLITSSFQNYISQFKSHPIHIVRCLSEAENEYKVIYCTDDNVRFSRIAKLNEFIYLESSKRFYLNSLNSEEKKFIHSNFGDISLTNYDSNTIYPGRFKQLDENISEEITSAYVKHDIFLLGRMANWKFKLVEDIFSDSKSIYNQICSDLKVTW